MYPAVESLERLAEAVIAHYPGQSVLHSHNAEFLRFLELPAGKPEVDALADIGEPGNDGVTASLCTAAQAPQTGISRTRDHVRVTFVDAETPVPLTLDIACAAEGICYRVPAERLYKELVRFGPSFHNAVGTLSLFQDGAVAPLKSPETASSRLSLGSPFVLDAAFHVACAWGQRYHGFIAFPVGYAERSIVRPTVAGELYFCRVVPRGAEKDVLIFDIWIYDQAGALCEVASGVRMKNVFKDKMPVPEWIKTAGQNRLHAIRERIAGSSVVELASMLPFAEKALSARESEIVQQRQQGKRNRYHGTRIALKRLARILYKDRAPYDPVLIETIAPDRLHPACAVPGEKQEFYCSASHDERFAVAVGGRNPIGVDVERLSNTLLKGAHIYMTPHEQIRSTQSPLGEIGAAIRVWTTKECAAKALDVPLTTVWSGIELKEIGEDQSIISIGGRNIEAVHATVDDHVFTVLEIPRD